ncbi:MAG TPA: coproporphyrinogen III oxidase [Elusimicrobia bacterium]|nr:coproporphyrinogen III oxidase [Elusimicrobiota bacterium]
MNADRKNNIEAGRLVPAIYIHIPFCRKKCNYCDFVSTQIDADKTTDCADKYLKALTREFAYRLPSTVYRLPSTVYVGGGTPSLLSESQIKFLFEKLFNYFHNYESSIIPEITFELNPESITGQKLKTLKDYGVNRLSIGLQSFDDDILKFLGRVHNVKDFLRCYETARKIGFMNINIDLIFGIPGQTLENWHRTLNGAIKLNPEHISIYSLTIENGTKFFENGLQKDDDTDADMYEFAIRFLKENGYHQYEISNFAKPSFECKHNINYWKNGEYLGFGLGAVSYIKGRRIKNTENLTDYLNGKFRSEVEERNPEQKMSEDLMLGLRLTSGMEISDNIKEKFSARINNLKNDGLLKEQNNFLKLTDKGIMFANCVFREFL